MQGSSGAKRIFSGWRKFVVWSVINQNDPRLAGQDFCYESEGCGYESRCSLPGSGVSRLSISSNEGKYCESSVLEREPPCSDRNLRRSSSDLARELASLMDALAFSSMLLIWSYWGCAVGELRDSGGVTAPGPDSGWRTGGWALPRRGMRNGGGRLSATFRLLCSFSRSYREAARIRFARRARGSSTSGLELPERSVLG